LTSVLVLSTVAASAFSPEQENMVHARRWHLSLLVGRRAFRFTCSDPRKLAMFLQAVHLLAVSHCVEEVAV